MAPVLSLVMAFDAGDWCLCNGAAAGWVRIDTLNGGGGGGGGATNLGDLLDVSIASASTGALLQLQASGLWADTYGIDGGDILSVSKLDLEIV